MSAPDSSYGETPSNPVEDSEYQEIRRAASGCEMSIAEWVRQALSLAAREELGVQRKLVGVRAAAKHEFPTSDIDTMLAEIERGSL